ncbi:MAG: hypothetical protein ABFS02_03870 [Pseudomonadota bacterium]
MYYFSLALLFLVSASASAEESVYRCQKEGKVLYSSSPRQSYECGPMSLYVIRPSQAEVERHRRDMAKREAQLLKIEESNRMQRMLEAEEDAAQEARRQAEAEKAQALYLQDLQRFEQERRGARYRSRYFYLNRMPPPLPPVQPQPYR